MSHLLMRKVVGAIGIAVPFVLIGGDELIGGHLRASLSGYYYTPLRNFFVGGLCALAMLFFAYTGRDRADAVITSIAGVCTVGTAFCPTLPARAHGHQVVVGIIHLGFAGVAFLLLAVMSLRFAKRVPTPPGLPLARRVRYAFGFTPPGRGGSTAETVVYRASGAAMLACLALVYPLSAVFADSLLVLETIMLEAFGLAWLVKGGAVRHRESATKANSGPALVA